MLKICLTGDGYTSLHFDKLKKHGFIITHRPDPLSQNDLQMILPSYDAYVLGGDERLTSQVLDYASNLRLISFVGTGYTSFIDEIAAKKLNIAIRSTPNVNAQAVAEHTIGLLIGLQRKLFQHNWQVKHDKVQLCHSNELSSICIGIVGLGAIGSRIAKILRLAFGSDVIYTSQTPKPHLESELNITYVSQDTLFSKADAIVLALPTNQKTEYFIDETVLAKTKKGVIIINTAGARLIEPIALKKYIDNDHISAVAFDGYYIEPLPSVADDPFNLLRLSDECFVVTPHVAAKTPQSWSRMMDQSIDNVIDFFHDKT